MNRIMAALTLDQVSTPWLWLVGIVVGAMLLILTYRSIFIRSGKRLAWLLLGLRAGGLMLLVIALAKPTWTREQEQVEAGRVGVIIDDSVSMSLDDAPGSTRFQKARDTVEAIRTAAAAKFGSKLIIDRYDISGRLIDGELPTSPTAERTDLARAVREVASHSRSQPLAGVVLISDGMDNIGRSDFQDLTNLPVPVYTLGFPVVTDPATLDLAVRKPQAPTRAMVHNEVPISVPVVKVGAAAAAGKVVIRRGNEVVASQEVTFPAGSSEQTIAVKWTPAQPGSFRMVVAIESTTPEPVLTNNAEGFDIQIDGEPIRITYIEGTLRWESKYLLTLLRDDPDIRLESIIRIVNPDRFATRAGAESITSEKLSKTDIVILGDLEGKFLSDAEYVALTTWLEGKNHALMVLGGYRGFGPDGWATTPLAKVLPVQMTTGEPFQREGRFAMALTEEGRQHPAFALTADRAADVETWTQQGELEGLSLVQREKPGATVLAVHPGQSIDGKPAIVMAWQPFGAGGKSVIFTGDTTWRWSRLPRLIGRSDNLYTRFWSQTIRWMAGRNVDDQRPLIALATDRPAYEPGKSVSVTLTRYPRAGVDLTDAEATLELRTADGQPVLNGEGKPMTLPARANSANPDAFLASFTPPSGGRYKLTGSLAAGGKLLANQESEFFVQSSALELSDPRTNPANLEAIARITRGEAFELSQVKDLVDQLAPRERRTVQVVRAEYWNSPWLFAGFLAAVTVEWLIRRRNHMV